jgi:hypothetical protein
MTKSKGLGDTIAKITKATGIDKVAKKVLGEDCGCDERRDKLNKMFPYKKVRQFTPDEMSIYESIMPNIKNDIIKAQDQANLVKLYNKVFNANKKPSGCSSCVRSTMAGLKKVYENSCKIEDNEEKSDV